ncbi:MFS transporter [Leucobacter sp. L43]|uniref:MFS transporter n=1 Tax=Leucobacter sp. L43 TaxID=2798040 RepID=UPI001905F5A2|nr:MFS transporter [Leucobacter sp. L43]
MTTKTLHERKPKPHSMRRVAAAAFVGTTLEWYDYYLFGTAAALVFGHTFFVADDPITGTLAAFATFAVGFVVRPLGAVLFGHIGDRWGRKRSLIMTVILMGVVTGTIGVLPDYTQIGVWAPIILVVLRLFQGLAMGGEWSGASALITEHADSTRRGFYAMLPQMGNPLGILLGVLLFTGISSVVPEDEFIAWAWRIPFLLAVPFALIALWIRSSIDESTSFKKTQAIRARNAPAPIVQILRSYKLPVLLGLGAGLLGTAGYYFADTFMLNYGSQTLGIDYTSLLNASLITAALNIPLFLLWGVLANRLGGFKVAIIGSIISLVLAYPMFALVGIGTAFSVGSAMVLGGSMVSIAYAAYGQIVNEIFPTEVRQSAIGVAYGLTGAVAGFIPFIATLVMNASDGSVWWTGSLLVLLAALSLVSVIAARRFRRAEL